MVCTANRLSRGMAHLGQHEWVWTDERFWNPACDNNSHRSLLWWWHPIFSICPILLTSWHSCTRDNHCLYPSLKHHQQLSYLPLHQLCIKFLVLYTVNPLNSSITVHYHQQLQISEIITLEYTWRKLSKHWLKWQWNWRITVSWLSKSFINIMLCVSVYPHHGVCTKECLL